MVRFYEWHIDHEARLVLLAGLICLVACLVSLGLMVRARADGLYHPRIALAAALVFAAGLSATLFAFMLACRPGIALRYQLAATLLSVAAAMAIAWFALAIALCLRAADATAAGRYPDGMATPLAAEFSRLGDIVSRVMSAAWHGHGRRRALAAASLLALMICGLDFIAIRGTPTPANPTVEKPVSVSDGVLRPNPLARGPGRLADREGQARMAEGFATAALAPPAASPGPLVPARDSTAKDKSIAALVTEIATAQKIDPLLVLAVIATESGFQADAVSPGNAQGLMQLTPETARRFGARDLLDPAENIRAGTLYLRWLLAYFEGDLSLALAAYNAGEGAVIHYGGVPPFPETRAYLRKVQTLYPAEHHPFDQLAAR